MKAKVERAISLLNTMLVVILAAYQYGCYCVDYCFASVTKDPAR